MILRTQHKPVMFGSVLHNHCISTSVKLETSTTQREDDPALVTPCSYSRQEMREGAKKEDKEESRNTNERQAECKRCIFLKGLWRLPWLSFKSSMIRLPGLFMHHFCNFCPSPSRAASRLDLNSSMTFHDHVTMSFVTPLQRRTVNETADPVNENNETVRSWSRRGRSCHRCITPAAE